MGAMHENVNDEKLSLYYFYDLLFRSFTSVVKAGRQRKERKVGDGGGGGGSRGFTLIWTFASHPSFETWNKLHGQ
jgi:hypothetical protein